MDPSLKFRFLYKSICYSLNSHGDAKYKICIRLSSFACYWERPRPFVGTLCYVFISLGQFWFRFWLYAIGFDTYLVSLFNPYSFFGNITERVFCLIECQLGFIVTLILKEIFQYVRKYAVLNKNICHFWDHHGALFPKKFKAQKHVCCGIDFFRKTRLVTALRFGFFRDSRIRVKSSKPRYM